MLHHKESSEKPQYNMATPAPPILSKSPFSSKNFQTPCALRLVETFWLVETFVSECLNFN